MPEVYLFACGWRGDAGGAGPLDTRLIATVRFSLSGP